MTCTSCNGQSTPAHLIDPQLAATGDASGVCGHCSGTHEEPEPGDEIRLSREGSAGGAPCMLRVRGDSENGDCWAWLLFYLADKRTGEVIEPWVEMTLHEARALRDQLSRLLRVYGADRAPPTAAEPPGS